MFIRMDLWRYSDSMGNREKLENELDRIGIIEKAKFKTEFVNGELSYEENMSKQSHMVVTILVQASGPLLNSKSWNIRNRNIISRALMSLFKTKSVVPSQTDIMEYLVTLPTYLKKIKTLENNMLDTAESGFEDEDDIGSLIPGFKLKLIWVPNQVSIDKL